jgi:hypothetical protein
VQDGLGAHGGVDRASWLKFAVDGDGRALAEEVTEAREAGVEFIDHRANGGAAHLKLTLTVGVTGVISLEVDGGHRR